MYTLLMEQLINCQEGENNFAAKTKSFTPLREDGWIHILIVIYELVHVHVHECTSTAKRLEKPNIGDTSSIWPMTTGSMTFHCTSQSI